MLKQLSISNYAIIDSLEIDFDPHLNIITGETGAGKSIILGALNMILGKRADSAVLRESNIKAVIEGVFEVGHLRLQQLFERLDMEYEDETIIRREIRPNGKSRAFVNDSPVNLEQLRTLTIQLVDLHAQQDSSAVLDKQFYISILDRLSGQQDAVAAFREKFRKYRDDRKKLIEARQAIADQQSDQDYLEFQFHELSELDLQASDGNELESELTILENAGQIIAHLQSVTSILQDGEMNAVHLLSESADQLSKVSGYSKELTEISERLASASIEIEDIARSSQVIAESTDIDESRLAELRERQTAINRLLQKHQAEDVEALIFLKDTLEKRLKNLQTSDEDLCVLEAEVEKMRVELNNRAGKISGKRMKFVSRFETEAMEILKAVGMPHARIELEHTKLDDDSMHEAGLDDFRLLFSANKGVDLQPLKAVASGGERSRLMLSIKSIIARYMQLSTMVFDEIDTGISGEVAAKVGEIFKSMSTDHQIISITHLPQIAAQADSHLYVYKDDSSKKTTARVKLLDEDDKILEIAKMLSGDDPGEAAVMAASELVCSA